MKNKQEIGMLMESYKWNWATNRVIGGNLFLENLYRDYIRALAWVLGHDDIALKCPDHYYQEGCHSMRPDSEHILKEYNKITEELKEDF
jgi:hypothetical protein|tara:strand:+ start:2529 stop:2795 length:267 start_codon:yes stop_codon:yes gene_type:complete